VRASQQLQGRRRRVSGLPDDSCAASRALRDPRARVKAARAPISATLGLSETLARDWRRAAAF
jgi:hypothetical protein